MSVIPAGHVVFLIQQYVNYDRHDLMSVMFTFNCLVSTVSFLPLLY